MKIINHLACAANVSRTICLVCRGGNAWGSIALIHVQGLCMNKAIEALEIGLVCIAQVMREAGLIMRNANNV